MTEEQKQFVEGMKRRKLDIQIMQLLLKELTPLLVLR